jgi:hypothetical protein
MSQHKNLIYRVWYLPFVMSDKNPKYYCGSKYHYKGNYFGSPSAKLITEYSNGMSLKDWWKSEIKRDKSNFYFEILEICDPSCTPEQLILKEVEWHTKLNVLSEDYFNQCIAAKNFYSRERRGPASASTKRKQSQKTTEYWASTEGMAKKERVKQRNKEPKQFNKLWELTSPTGDKIITSNLSKTCKEYDLINENMVTLANKRTGSTHHKGWTIVKLK